MSDPAPATAMPSPGRMVVLSSVLTASCLATLAGLALLARPEVVDGAASYGRWSLAPGLSPLPTGFPVAVLLLHVVTAYAVEGMTGTGPVGRSPGPRRARNVIGFAGLVSFVAGALLAGRGLRPGIEAGDWTTYHAGLCLAALGTVATTATLLLRVAWAGEGRSLGERKSMATATARMERVA